MTTHLRALKKKSEGFYSFWYATSPIYLTQSSEKIGVVLGTILPSPDFHLYVGIVAYFFPLFFVAVNMAGVSFPVCADRHLAQPEVHYQKRPVVVGMRRREHGKSIFVRVALTRAEGEEKAVLNVPSA